MNSARDVFSAQWQSLGGQVFLVPTVSDWEGVARQALGALMDADLPSVVGFDDGSWPEGVPWQALCQNLGADYYDMNAQSVSSHKQTVKGLIAEAGIGITGAAWAAADTGTVALYASGVNSLSASLLPPNHIIVLNQNKIFGTLREGLQALHHQQTLPPLVKLVSGPSMTADIEGQLVIGVHGPGKVTVLIGAW